MRFADIPITDIGEYFQADKRSQELIRTYELLISVAILVLVHHNQYLQYISFIKNGVGILDLSSY